MTAVDMAPLHRCTGVCRCFPFPHPPLKKKDCQHRKPEVQIAISGTVLTGKVVGEMWEEQWRNTRVSHGLPLATQNSAL
eukprot:14517559-Ditylum_brightwellii.AAC.1